MLKSLLKTATEILLEQRMNNSLVLGYGTATANYPEIITLRTWFTKIFFIFFTICW